MPDEQHCKRSRPQAAPSGRALPGWHVPLTHVLGVHELGSPQLPPSLIGMLQLPLFGSQPAWRHCESAAFTG